MVLVLFSYTIHHKKNWVCLYITTLLKNIEKKTKLLLWLSRIIFLAGSPSIHSNLLWLSNMSLGRILPLHLLGFLEEQTLESGKWVLSFNFKKRQKKFWNFEWSFKVGNCVHISREKASSQSQWRRKGWSIFQSPCLRNELS